MSRTEAIQQYEAALKLGQKYYHDAIRRSRYPYPLVLDEILDEHTVAGRAELGIINIPSDLIIGTKSAGRTAALAGNFMPLLNESSEFAGKWITLCEAHLSDEGIRDPIECFEYLGRFYIQEGNKRASVLMSFGAPTVPGRVTRIIPEYSDDRDIQLYYEFMQFYSVSGMYGVSFRNRGDYLRLLALLVWLEVFPFSDIKELSLTDLVQKLQTIWPDVLTRETKPALEVISEPENRSQGVLSRLFSFTHPDHVKVAFIYAYPPESSAWTRAHDHGREYLEKTLGDKVTVSVYHAYNRDYYTEMVKAVSDGAQVIFATTPPMIDACRRIASAFKNVKVLNCALSRPYTGVRMYYSRIYECKFITGAIAGAMAENDLVGYISNFPIIGDPANINAFALGVRMTNPRAKIALRWSCLPGNPLRELMDEGAAVISNRDATNSTNIHWALEWGTYKLAPDGNMTPLAVPCWDWGKFYERVILSILNGSWAALSGDRSVNYWWGLSSGVVSIQFSDLLPPGVASMGKMLVNGISSGFVHPFKTRITDQNGLLRNDGSEDFSSAALMDMDWLCDNIEGSIPSYDELLPFAKETVRLFGLSRNLIIPEKETEQL